MVLVMARQSDNVIRLRELAAQAADAEWPDEEPTEIKVVVQPQEKAEMVERGASAIRTVIDGMKGWSQVVALLILVAGGVIVYYISKL
jgi:4-hydroxy-3-methylbut-2-enyl diphosphate reductase IspH